MFDLSLFAPDPETIGTYRSGPVGDSLREGLAETYPKETIEVVSVTKEGHQVFEMRVRTDPLTIGEMRAYVGGFFRAFNNRHKIG
jgi:hypothetical protein